MQIKQNNFLQKIILIGLCFGLILLGAVLLYLPANYFDSGQAMCISVLAFDRECYGCGMTRAIQHLIHLDFDAAFTYNKMSFIVFPLLVFMILREIKIRYVQLISSTKMKSEN